ncbi:NAD(P)-dependent oxidoreductase [Telmatobacter sp. DSM 110680]|uniref:NAD(P)-dependent oxidoreductase n=1 Tax=Telmatobacter sp. DSM 110680 TaxID=3036704 RepID=A0AAU7DD12_9BACT
MNILVTGGAGYVGSTLVPLLLADGHRVRVLDSILHGGDSLLGVWPHPNFEFVRGDVCDRSVLKKTVAGIDAVVHLAAIVGDPACSRQPDVARAVNLDASLNLIEESQKAGVNRFVFASTCSNYGRMKDPNVYVDEESELSPVSLYAETKVAVEKALLDSGNSGRWCPTPLRFATVFGVSSRMRFDLTVNEFTMEMLTKKHLKVFGEQFWRPYIHVRDASRAIHLVLTSPSEKVARTVFNVGATDQNWQKQQLVEMIRPHAPDAVVEFVHRQEDPRDYRVSFTKIANRLHFEITRTVAQGIEEVAHLVRSGVIRNLSDERYRN